MRFTIATRDALLHFMRRAGYGLQKEVGGETAFVRRVSGAPFPRYHAYVADAASSPQLPAPSSGGKPVAGSRKLVINLHVDQKAPTYGSGAAHSGEYDGSLVEQEEERLRSLAQLSASRDESSGGEDGTERRGFWERLFR